MSVPYTYIIGWSDHNKWYYGCQYSSKSHPQNLWTKYFTSSKSVFNFRKEYGEPDIVLVCETFDDPLDAKKWEDDVLLSIPKDQYSYWLNKRFGSFKGVVDSPERREKLRLTKLGTIPWNKGKTNADFISLGKKIIPGKPKGSKEKESTKKKKSDSQKKKVNIRNLTTGEYMRVDKEVGYEMIKNGEWGLSNAGRKMPPHTEDTKKKFSEIAKNRPIHYCEVCDRSIQGNMNWDRHLTSVGHLSHL
jgi:hypothetical protein